MPGAQMGAINIGDIFGKMGGGRTKTRKVTVLESHEILVAEESDKLLDQEQLVLEAIKSVENNGIVFLDEIDKITARDGPRRRRRVAARACSAICWPLIEGTTVSHQARRGEDRPHPVHRLRCLPLFQAVGPAAPSCRAACRSALS